MAEILERFLNQKEDISIMRGPSRESRLGKNNPNYKHGNYVEAKKKIKKGWNSKSIGNRFKKGVVPWNKGKLFEEWNPNYEGHTEETKEKIRKKHIGMKKPWVAERNKKLRGVSKRGRPFWQGRTFYQNYAKENLIQECNKCECNEQLVVHHKDTNHFNNISENLEILCRSCHISLHYQLIKGGKDS